MQELAVRFSEHFQEWKSNHSVGLSVLQSYRACLAGLELPKAVNKDFFSRLSILAPSGPLANYIANKGARSNGGQSSNPIELQDNYIILQNCVKKSTRLHRALEKTALDACTAVQQQFDFARTAIQTDLPAEEPFDLVAEPIFEQPAAGVAMDAAALTIAATPAGPAGPVAAPAAGTSRTPPPASAGSGAAEIRDGEGGRPQVTHQELAVMMTLLCEALHQECDLMVRVVESLTLDTPLDHLYTYITMWELQPFLDDALLEAVAAELPAAPLPNK